MTISSWTTILLALASTQRAYTWSTKIATKLTRNNHALQVSNVLLSSIHLRVSSALFSNQNLGEFEELLTQLPSMGLNELQTQFRLAIALQDLNAAELFRDELAKRVSYGAAGSTYNGHEVESDHWGAKLSWAGLGTAPWLIERLDALDFPLPTTIQINAFQAVNTILSIHDTTNRDDVTLEERFLHQSPRNMGIVISGSTGSGKTLAFLVPTLSTLSQTLFTRERIRIKAEEDVGDVMGDLLDRVMVQASPTVQGQGYNQLGGQGGRTTLTGAALSSLGKSGTDVTRPVCLIVVPTKELGVQIALTVFQLVGGNVKKTASERSGAKNMFKYKGPKGVKIGCVLDEEASVDGLKLQTDIAITTPKYLTKLMNEGDIDPSKLRVIIFDEADLGLEKTSSTDLKLLFDNYDSSRQFSRVSYLVGATVTESLGNLAVKDEILPEGNSFIATATKFSPLTKDSDMSKYEVNQDSTVPFLSSLKDLSPCLDPGLCHERVIAPDNTGLLCLTRLLRKELREYEIACERGEETCFQMTELERLRQETNELLEEDLTVPLFKSSNAEIIANSQRPRVVVFFPDENSAREAIQSLRDAMWGDHRLGALLPDTGEVPLQILEKFKRGDLTVLLATPNAIRGLDFPELTHVYTLFLPANDPREYLHLAGRVGRIGQQGSVRGKGGKVTTILDPWVAPLYEEMASVLGFDFTDVEPLQAEVTPLSDVEAMRRYLEDTVTLLGTVDEPEVNYDQIENQETLDEDDEFDADDDVYYS